MNNQSKRACPITPPRAALAAVLAPEIAPGFSPDNRGSGKFGLHPLGRTLCVLLTTMLAGCNVGPKYHAPAPPAPPAFKESPTQFKESDGWKVAQPQDAVLRGKWWEIYNNSELNALEEQLNIDNQNIRQYFENFLEARALVREARSQYFPTLTVGAGLSSGLGTSSSTTAATTTTTTGSTSSNSKSSEYTLPLEVSWEPDLFGKIRNTVHASQYAAQLSAADLENERLIEQASLAEYYFEIRGQDALQKILDDTVAADTKALNSTKGAYETGVGTQISVVEAQTTLQAAQSAAINLGIARAQYEHAIATLLGKPASSFSVPVQANLTLPAPPPIPIGLPSQLLERRPDIAAAERNMAAANAQIGVAKAAYYPDLTLTAGFGFENSSLAHLFDWSSHFLAAGPSVSETLYDGGLRRATVNQYIATYNANLAAYRQTVLTAFQQVEDYLAAVRILSQQVIRQQEAVNSSQTYVKLEMGRYNTGIDPYVNVVTAQTTLLTNQQNLANLQIQEMTASVELIQALGGGWDRSQLPTPAQVTQPPSRSGTTIQQ
jgi:NodT family efflux transporter outer membrane factor (OMF) lipoprotein